MRSLNERGYPIKPNSFFVGVRRYNIPTIQMIQDVLVSGAELRIPIKRDDEWTTLSGRVSGIIAFPDGYVVLFPQNSRSPIKWPDAVLWIQNEGPCGILD